MATQIQLRRDTAANWTANNPILAEGEKGIETDGLGTSTVLSKIGNGVDDWNTLPYQSTGVGAVDSVNGETGAVVLDTSDISEVTDKKYVTDAEKTVISNTSNTNTGDQDLSSLAIKATLTQDGGNVTGSIDTNANTFNLTSSGGESVIIQLPTIIEAVIGDTIQLFYQAMVSTPNYDNYHFVGESEIPSESQSLPRYFETTPTTTGTRELTFYVLGANNQILDQKTTTLKVLDAVNQPPSLLSFWNIGDSFIANSTSNNELVRRLTGTGGVPVGNEFGNFFFHREGNSGKEWNWYVTNEDSPFVYSGVLDFEQYRIDNALNVPNVALLNLTWNGVGVTRDDAAWDLWDDDVYTFIDTLKTTFPDIDVKLVSPSMPSTLNGESVIVGATGLENYGDEYLLKVNLLRMAQIYERIKGEVGYEYVQHIQASLQVDSVYNVGSTPKDVNTRNSISTELIGNDNVHPTTEGYYQIADAQYRNIINEYCQTVGGNFKINFNSSNSEYLSGANFVLNSDFVISVDVLSNLNVNTQYILTSNTSQITLFTDGRVLFDNDTEDFYLTTQGTLPSTGVNYNFKMQRVGTEITLYVDNVLVDTIPSYLGGFVFTDVGKSGAGFFDGQMDNLVVDNNGTIESFLFSEGTGSTTSGSLGNVLTLNSTGNVNDMWIPE
jgi:hypothetical protein